MSRYLVRDDSVLDLPPTRQLWLLFGLVVSVLVGLLLLILQDFQEDLANSASLCSYCSRFRLG